MEENGYYVSWDKNNKIKLFNQKNFHVESLQFYANLFVSIFPYIMVKLITAKYNERKMIIFG